MNVKDEIKIDYDHVEHHIFPEGWPFRQLPNGELDPVYDYSSTQRFEEMSEHDLNHWINKISKIMRLKWREFAICDE